MSAILLRYCPSRLQIGMALVTLFAMLTLFRLSLLTMIGGGTWVAQSSLWQWRVDFFLPIVLIVTGAILWRMWGLLRGDGAALRTTDEGLEVTTFFRRRVVPWADLLGSQNITYWTGPHRRRRLTIRYFDNGDTRTLRIPTILTERPSGGHDSLPEKIERAQASVVGNAGPLGSTDPDAAIARYLAAKEAAGREVVTDKPVADPASPPVQRPVFGRKGTA